ncbi:hypothetical protein Ddc_23177 [Ditylenchus destructor]|nr:hypothetical protein Ddc_23177 [Ditylenchus destructor]
MNARRTGRACTFGSGAGQDLQYFGSLFAGLPGAVAQGQHACGEVACIGHVVLRHDAAQVRVAGQGMDEHAAGAETTWPQVFQHGIAGALAGQQQHQQWPGATATGEAVDHLNGWQLCQLHAQLQRTQATGLQERRQAPRGMRADVLPPVADPAGANVLDGMFGQPSTQFVVTADQQAAFMQAQALASSQAEESDIATQADTAVADPCAECLCGVLDHPGAGVAGDFAGQFDIGDAPAQVGRQDRQRARIGQTPELAGIKVEVATTGIAQLHAQAQAVHRDRHQRAGIGRHDHGVAPWRALAQRTQRDQQCMRAGTGQLQWRCAELAGQDFAQVATSGQEIAGLNRQASGRWQFAREQAHRSPLTTRFRRDCAGRPLQRGRGRRCRPRSVPHRADGAGSVARSTATPTAAAR